MRVTKEKAAEHRAAIVEAAARLFRDRGFDGVGVAEIMQAAGLTHGGFYGHFASKDALAAEACGSAFTQGIGRFAARAADAGLAGYVATYLTAEHRDRRGGGCPMAAFATEIGHQDPQVQAAFAEGLAGFIDAVAARLPAAGDDATAADGHDDETRRARAIGLLAAMVGGMALARATAEASPKLSAEILEAVKVDLQPVAAS